MWKPIRVRDSHRPTKPSILSHAPNWHQSSFGRTKQRPFHRKALYNINQKRSYCLYGIPRKQKPCRIRQMDRFFLCSLIRSLGMSLTTAFSIHFRICLAFYSYRISWRRFECALDHTVTSSGQLMSRSVFCPSQRSLAPI